MLDRNTIHETDIFDLCGRLDPQSVDMILCDLPYGTTACSWDVVIPFAPMWDAFKRIIKPRGAIVLTASQPFTSLLVCSNLEMFNYSWLWHKNRVTGFVRSHEQPLRQTEDIVVFGGKNYYPQNLRAANIRRVNSVTVGGASIRQNYEKAKNGGSLRTAGKIYQQDLTNYPTNVLAIDCETITVHPTQKPVALFEYLIRTYTRPGELVFDPCVGSGTTALAARNTGRDYIVGDSSPEYVAIARRRLDAPYTLPLIPEESQPDKIETIPMELDV